MREQEEEVEAPRERGRRTWGWGAFGGEREATALRILQDGEQELEQVGFRTVRRLVRRGLFDGSVDVLRCLHRVLKTLGHMERKEVRTGGGRPRVEIVELPGLRCYFAVGIHRV
eukprot:3912089-Rhodomonas_salina.5